jgi:hypothetical protein
MTLLAEEIGALAFHKQVKNKNNAVSAMGPGGQRIQDRAVESASMGAKPPSRSSCDYNR